LEDVIDAYMTGCTDGDGPDDDFEDEDAKTKEDYEKFKLWLDQQADCSHT
jgi:hypothetical protein